jgi:2-hydroxychromene-2-carboxylate isomerase
MPAPAVRFYFDYVSSNAYLAWTQLPHLAGKYGFTIEPVPVLFAGVTDWQKWLGPPRPSAVRRRHRPKESS